MKYENIPKIQMMMNAKKSAAISFCQLRVIADMMNCIVWKWVIRSTKQSTYIG